MTATWAAAERAPLVRLERLLSNRGVGSRSECAALVKAGRVRVGGKVVKAPSARVPATDAAVMLRGSPVPEVPLLMAYHKPIGVLSTVGDPSGRPSLKEAVPTAWGLMGLHPVGRLDADTSGLLLFSSHGHLTERLLRPATGVERECVATRGGSQY